MSRFQRGQRVLVPCEVQPGPFPTERLITVRTDDGEVSGFVQIDFLVSQSGPAAPTSGPGFVLGVIDQETEERVLVRLPGSFFTTASGQTSVSSSWARDHLQTTRDLHP